MRRRRALLVCPAQSYRTGAYLHAAQALGVDIVVASDGAHSLVPELAAGIHLDPANPRLAIEAVVAEHRRARLDAVLATDDAMVEVAARMAAAIGLPHNPLDAVRAARRKDLARAALQRAGVATPRFRRLDLSTDLAPQIDTLDYPVVVKPLAMAASRGVIRADDPRALAAACARVGAIISTVPDPFEARHVLVESFIEGAEIAVEGLLDDGRLERLAVFDKPDPLDGPFFEETYYITPSRHPPALLDRAVAEVQAACVAFGLHFGPVHAELRLGVDGPRILEVAARTIGGDCARLLEFGTGHGLEKLILARALGMAIDPAARPGAAGVLMLPTPAAGTLRRVEGVLDAGRIPGIVDIVIAVREGYELVPLPEGGNYLGFIFARGDDPAEVEDALRAAHRALEVVIAPKLELLDLRAAPSTPG